MTGTDFTIELGGEQVRARFIDPDERTVPDELGCPGCDGPAYFSGCTAPDCNSHGCQDCALGCDLDFLDDDESTCAQAIADADDEDWSDDAFEDGPR